jgi:Ran GTPase-activating protein (RanGAP) involved in mRNA processing and transport
MTVESGQDRIWNAPVVMAAGAVLGVVFILAAIALCFWGENKTINTAVSLEQGAAKARSASAEKVDPANDGKLVHLTGDATAGEPLTDADFGISVKALRLTRDVEVYQWKETKTEGKKDAKPTYKYKADWHKEKPATKFAEPGGHVNPDRKPYEDAKLNAKDVKVGAFTLTSAQVEKIPVDENLPVTTELLAALPDDLKGRAKPGPDGVLFVGIGTPEAPQVGDARIRFKIARPQTVSLVAKQTQSTFEPFTPEAGESIDLLKPGSHAVSTMFEGAHTTTKVGAWLFRVLAFVLMTLGLYLVFRRQVSVSSGETPNVGFEVSVALFAAVLAIPLVALVVGARWITHQLLFGGGALAVGLIGIAGVILVTRTRKEGLFAGLFGGGKTWSPKERDYFRRIAIDPENAKLRLEFAAHLEKNGDPLGEFIRLYHEMETLPEGDDDREKINGRVTQLLNLHGATWYQGLRKLGLVPTMAGMFWPIAWINHGIIDQVRIERPGILPEKAEQLFAAAPGLREIEVIYLHTTSSGELARPDLMAIVQVPQLQQIGVLSISDPFWTLEELQAVASSPNLINLTELKCCVTDAGKDAAAIVAQSATLKRLRTLYLYSSNIGDEGAKLLAASPNFARLVDLTLHQNAIGDAGAKALAASAHLKNLQTLQLNVNELTPVGVAAVAGSPHFRQLTNLNLCGNKLGSEGAMALAKSPNTAKLTTLSLIGCGIGAGVSHLAASPQLGRLEVLHLGENAIDDAATAALAASKTIVQLKELALGANRIGDAGLQALAKWPGLARVTRLDLSQNEFTAAGVAALAESPYLQSLKDLTLSDNDVGIGGARALAKSTSLKSLESLFINEGNLTSEGEQLLRKRLGDRVYL